MTTKTRRSALLLISITGVLVSPVAISLSTASVTIDDTVLASQPFLFGVPTPYSGQFALPTLQPNWTISGAQLTLDLWDNPFDLCDSTTHPTCQGWAGEEQTGQTTTTKSYTVTTCSFSIGPVCIDSGFYDVIEQDVTNTFDVPAPSVDVYQVKPAFPFLFPLSGGSLSVVPGSASSVTLEGGATEPSNSNCFTVLVTICEPVDETDLATTTTESYVYSDNVTAGVLASESSGTYGYAVDTNDPGTLFLGGLAFGLVDPAVLTLDLSCSADCSSGPTGLVPEPTALALLGLGLVGVGFSRRRRAH